MIGVSIPELGPFRSPAVPYSSNRIVRCEYSGWLGVASGWTYLHFLKAKASWETIPESPVFGCWSIWRILMPVAIGLVVLLRTLKHLSGLWSEEGMR